MLLNFIC